MSVPAQAFKIKQHSRQPPLEAYLTLDDASPIRHLASAIGIDFAMRASGAPSAIFTSAASLVDATTGLVAHAWASGQTATVGRFEYEFRIVWAGSQPQGVPNEGYNPLRVLPNIA